MNRATRCTVVLGLAGFVLLPWYATEIANLSWKAGALFLGMTGRWWLLPLAIPLLAATIIAVRPRIDERAAAWLAASSFAGFAYLLAQGFALSLDGWNGGCP